MRGLTMTILAFCAVTTAAMADEADSSTASVAPAGFGAETRSWTDLQIGGASAVKDERPMPGEIATKVYERYVQSFAHAIPEQFTQGSFTGGGGGGGGTP